MARLAFWRFERRLEIDIMEDVEVTWSIDHSTNENDAVRYPEGDQEENLPEHQARA